MLSKIVSMQVWTSICWYLATIKPISKPKLMTTISICWELSGHFVVEWVECYYQGWLPSAFLSTGCSGCCWLPTVLYPLLFPTFPTLGFFILFMWLLVSFAMEDFWVFSPSYRLGYSAGDMLLKFMVCFFMDFLSVTSSRSGWFTSLRCDWDTGSFSWEVEGCACWGYWCRIRSRRQLLKGMIGRKGSGSTTKEGDYLLIDRKYKKLNYIWSLLHIQVFIEHIVWDVADDDGNEPQDP